jgi:hypothetical protein
MRELLDGRGPGSAGANDTHTQRPQGALTRFAKCTHLAIVLLMDLAGGFRGTARQNFSDFPDVNFQSLAKVPSCASSWANDQRQMSARWHSAVEVLSQSNFAVIVDGRKDRCSRGLRVGMDHDNAQAVTASAICNFNEVTTGENSPHSVALFVVFVGDNFCFRHHPGLSGRVIVREGHRTRFACSVRQQRGFQLREGWGGESQRFHWVLRKRSLIVFIQLDKVSRLGFHP